MPRRSQSLGRLAVSPSVGVLAIHRVLSCEGEQTIDTSTHRNSNTVSTGDEVFLATVEKPNFEY